MNFFRCSRYAYTNRQGPLPPYLSSKEEWIKYTLKPILMRIQVTAFIIGVAFLNVAANVHGQGITLKAKNETLTNVFAEIKKQTGYLFWYEDNLLKNTNKVDVDLKNVSLKEALDVCMKNQPLVYSINDKTIVVKAKEKGILNRMIEAIRSININGKVKNESGQVLTGASVKVKDTDKSTITNQNGEFYLENVDENAIIVISYLGYVTKELKAAPDMNINLMETTEKMATVEINAGYYKVKDRERTGSIARVDAKTIGQQPVSNPLAALIGRMPGVNIEQQSGLNGGGYKIEIRGQNSLRNTAFDNGNSPLYLINGIPFPSTSIANSGFTVIGISGLSNPLNSINPNDIESIEILKDADATAIYGSRGANGVVLITTKKAKAGKANYNLNVQQGASVINRKRDFLKAEEYFAMRNEAFKNDGLSPGPTHYDVNGTWDKNRYTDWQQTLIGGTANTTNLSAGISGGNEYTQFSVSGNYNKQTTVLPVDFANEKATGTLSINHLSENKKFNANFSVSYLFDLNKLPRLDFTTYLNLPPNAPSLYDGSGNLNWALNSNGAATWVNPVATAKQPYTAKTGNFISNGQLGYEVIPGLVVKSNFGYTVIRSKESLVQPISSLAPSQAATGTSRIGFNSIDTWNVEPQITYKHKLNDGMLDLIIGATLQSTNQASETIAGTGYTSDLLLENIAAAPTRTALNTSSLYKYAAVFGRVNYNYKGTYIINLTGRRDGSSRFGPDKQFANFGAIGAAWIFSNNSFIKDNLSALSFGKIRGSFGITGNDQIQDYGYLETYTATNPYIDGGGLFPAQLANPDYSWEKNKKLEAAMELGFFKDRVSLAVSWYRNRSSNQLVGYKLPDITGFSSIQYNLPATVQNTGWEFELYTTNIKGRSFSWTSSLNLTVPRNKLVAYPGIEGSSYANTYTVGASLYQQRKYRYLGVNPATGVYRYEDLNGNGVLDVGDRQPTAKAYTSHWYGGFQNSLNYKNISLDVFIQVVSKTVPTPFALTGLPGNMFNQNRDVLDRWQQPGDEVEFAKFSQNFITGGAGESYSLLGNSDRYADASFIRLKNVSLSYSFPASFTDKIKIRSLKLFMQGQNLLTLTKYPGDPEVADLRTLPTLRTVTAGLSISL